jgi:RNA polymerase sigma-70 factor (ECF subfamily)
MVIGELYSRYGHLVFGVCLKIIKNKQDSEDLTMQIFQGLGTKLNQHIINYFKAWIYQVVRNECLMFLRKNGKIREVDFNEQLDAHEEEEQDIINFDCFEHNLVQALNQLKNEQKQALELFYQQEKSYSQIAEHTNWDIKKVKSYIQNAKRNLKLLLQNICNER